MTIRRGGEYCTLYYYIHTHTHKCIHSDEGLYFTRFFFFFIRYVSLIASPSTFGTVYIIIIHHVYARSLSSVVPFIALFIARIVVKSRPPPRRPLRRTGIIFNIFFNPSAFARIKTVHYYTHTVVYVYKNRIYTYI